MYQQMCDILKVSGPVYLGEQAEKLLITVGIHGMKKHFDRVSEVYLLYVGLIFIMCRQS